MRYRTRILGVLLVAGTIVGLAAACGGSGAKPTAAAPAPSGAANGAAGIQAYLSCLNQHGVKIALPSGRPTNRPTARPTNRPTVRPTARPSGGTGRGFGGGGFGGPGGGGFGGGLFGNGGQPPSGVDQATWTAAQQACSTLQPSFGAGGARGGGADNSAMTAYRSCLQSHGVTFSGRLSTADPKTAAALTACAPLRPTGAPVPSRTS